MVLTRLSCVHIRHLLIVLLFAIVIASLVISLSRDIDLEALLTSCSRYLLNHKILNVLYELFLPLENNILLCWVYVDIDLLTGNEERHVNEEWVSSLRLKLLIYLIYCSLDLLGFHQSIYINAICQNNLLFIKRRKWFFFACKELGLLIKHDMEY